MTDAPPLLHRHRRLLAILLSVLWVGAFAATHIPKAHMPTDIHVSDKTLHAVGYFVLGAMLLLTLASRGKPRWTRVLLTLALLAAYGAVDEITQPLVNRTAAFTDWLADIAGTAAAVIIIELALTLTARHRSPDE
jgi:VanZ family protein